jgi:AcrR family transcriptional regulator
VFADRGYHDATLDDVLTAAGVSRGALYHYFRSKQELFLALLNERITTGIDDVSAVIRQLGIDGDSVAVAAAGFLDRIEGAPGWLPLLLEFLATGCRDPDARAGVVANFLYPARERAAALIRWGDPELASSSTMSPEELAIGATAMINGLAIQRALDPDAVPKDLPGRLLAALGRGACDA